ALAYEYNWLVSEQAMAIIGYSWRILLVTYIIKNQYLTLLTLIYSNLQILINGSTSHKNKL
ncbi:MAG TPA: hypothetical protein VE524_09010, partial [Nitrososphaeraceae archaeon]|nr:hypothetical protein [Nitrososphaeraceae archaeon]